MLTGEKILAALTALGLLLGVSCGIQEETSEADEINTILVQTADELNELLPEMVDENTVLEATSGSNLYFSYFYTLLNYSIDEVDVAAFESRMRPDLIKGVCNSVELQKFTSRGVTIRHIYSDKDRKEFSAIAIGPAECGTGQ